MLRKSNDGLASVAMRFSGTTVSCAISVLAFQAIIVTTSKPVRWYPKMARTIPILDTSAAQEFPSTRNRTRLGAMSYL